MDIRRFGPHFPRLFAAAAFQELSFALLIHLPGYLSGLGASEGRIGLLYAAAALLSLLSRPWLGRILDLTHRRTVLLVAASVNLAVVLALVTTTTFGPLLWGLFLAQRTVQIALFSAMLTYAADAIPLDRRTQGLAIFGLSGLFPVAIGGYVGDVVIEVVGFDGLFWVAATMTALSLVTVLTLPAFPVRGAQPRRSFWAALSQPTLLPLWLATLLFALGIESLFTFTRTFVDDRQVGSAGLFFLTYGLVAALTRIAGGRLYDALPHRALMTGSIVLYGVGLGLMAVAQGVGLLVAAGVATGAAHGALFPLLSSEVVNRARVSERGSAVATFTSIFDVALLAGAPVVGALIDGYDYLVAFAAVGATLVVGAAAYVAWDRRTDPAALVVEESLAEAVTRDEVDRGRLARPRSRGARARTRAPR